MGGEARDVGSMEPQPTFILSVDGEMKPVVRVPLREEWNILEGDPEGIEVYIHEVTAADFDEMLADPDVVALLEAIGSDEAP